MRERSAPFTAPRSRASTAMRPLTRAPLTMTSIRSTCIPRLARPVAPPARLSSTRRAWPSRSTQGARREPLPASSYPSTAPHGRSRSSRPASRCRAARSKWSAHTRRTTRPCGSACRGKSRGGCARTERSAGCSWCRRCCHRVRPRRRVCRRATCCSGSMGRRACPSWRSRPPSTTPSAAPSPSTSVGEESRSNASQPSEICTRSLRRVMWRWAAPRSTSSATSKRGIMACQWAACTSLTLAT
mmetsp:Transcript_22168/g.71640  ORF Transcript_22168/g.71640 Transcript_22168/m.71640 type:complete len:243 (-) Transcript_22168:2511-3239(-)